MASKTCIIHLLRNTVRFGSRRYWDQIARDLWPVYTAPTEVAARARFEEFAEKWASMYPAIRRLWENAWMEFIPFLDYDVEIRGTQRLRDHLRRPNQLRMRQVRSTVNLTHPRRRLGAA